MKAMHMHTHDDDSWIPEGFAALTLDDNGWVGTNNGFPHFGQPALFPADQAEAICYAWNGFAIKGVDAMLPNAEAVPDTVMAWLK